MPDLYVSQNPIIIFRVPANPPCEKQGSGRSSSGFRNTSSIPGAVSIEAAVFNLVILVKRQVARQDAINFLRFNPINT